MTPADTIRATAAPRVGWLRLSAEAWPAIAAALPAPWPAEAVGTDLGWWRDQLAQGRVARIPSHRSLAERWGWSEWHARRALRQLGPQPTENREKTERRPTAQQESQVSHYDAAGLSRLDDEDRERAEAAAPTHDHAAEVERQVAARLLEEEAEERRAEETRRAIAAGSVELQAARVELERRQGRAMEPGDLAALRARMSRAAGGCTSAEEVLLVDRWARESPHREAVFLRDIGAGVRTLLNDRFPQRLVWAREWGAGAAQAEQPKASAQGRQGQPKALARQLEALVGLVREQAPPVVEVRQLEAAPVAPAARLSLAERFERGDLW